MTSRRSRKRTIPSIPQRWRRALAALVAVAVVIGGLCLYDYISVNLWNARDEGRLETYPVVLIENEQEVPRSEDDRHKQLNRLLINDVRKAPRNPVNVSRSELKYNLLRTHAYVKVFLETALPDKPDRRSRLKALYKLKRSRQGWQLAREPDLTTIE
ncbi:hypothetical protein AMJ85_04375 [candidate division BRC1 bacterium SM23_51]|nr:MAG: hypothetical protein AMJ85_04375 [candidate division BRC1 bacterium SM23_51]